jgi:N-carbamoyl-L-amino-acid hydrolase
MTGDGVSVDIDRLMGELDQLARISDTVPPAVTRILFTDTDSRAREFLKSLCMKAELRVRVDAIGNTFARWDGTDPHLPAVGTGSHIDAIPHSGRYDGTVGVFGGLEAIRALKASGATPRRSIELLMFTSEEPTRFGVGCIGSRALSGALSAEKLAELRDVDGHRLDDVRQDVGLGGPLGDVRLDRATHYAAFVELHIEQGPILEREMIPIGVVTAIAAPAALRVRIDGEAGHAGTVLMPDRKDALCAAAEMVLAVEAAAKATGSTDTVATTGICRVHPGASNSIPSTVTLEIDVRDIELERRDRVVRVLQTVIAQRAAVRRVRADVELLNADPPATMADTIITAAESACHDVGLRSKRMVSRAYHDSLFMAQVCPTGMIFIPCRGGVSHRPDEYASPEAIRFGVDVLARTLATLAG